MIRCTIEMVTRGHEDQKRVIGVVEIANIGGSDGEASYAVALKKTPPFDGALKKAWKSGMLSASGHFLDDVQPGETDEVYVSRVGGFDRVRRGCYDLLYLALKSCGLDDRNG